MRYCDTSFVAPLIREEAQSLRVAQFAAALAPGELAISQWTQVEVASLLARDVRMGAITTTEAGEADALFAEISRRSFVVLSPDGRDFDLARRYLHAYESALRAGDALHLAIAGNRQADCVCTLDKGMLRAGAVLGLRMTDGAGAF